MLEANIYLDTASYGARALELSLASYGVGRLLYGSDVPVIESGALSHESMESTDVEVRLHGDTAVVTGITISKGQFMGQGFTTRERATDVLARLDGRWLCVFSQLTRVASA